MWSELVWYICILTCELLQAPVPKYTSHAVNKRNNQGWNLKGRNAFSQLCKKVKEDRIANGAAFDIEFTQFIRDVYGKEKPTETKDGDEQEEEFDEFALLDANGQYQPSKNVELADTVGSLKVAANTKEGGEI